MTKKAAFERNTILKPGHTWIELWTISVNRMKKVWGNGLKKVSRTVEQPISYNNCSSILTAAGTKYNTQQPGFRLSMLFSMDGGVYRFLCIYSQLNSLVTLQYDIYASSAAQGTEKNVRYKNVHLYNFLQKNFYLCMIMGTSVLHHP